MEKPINQYTKAMIQKSLAGIAKRSGADRRTAQFSHVQETAAREWAHSLRALLSIKA